MYIYDDTELYTERAREKMKFTSIQPGSDAIVIKNY
jgi:hypothetical protein